MCTVTYNVSAVLSLMIGMETANKINTLLFHPQHMMTCGPCMYRNISSAHIQLDAHCM